MSFSRSQVIRIALLVLTTQLTWAKTKARLSATTKSFDVEIRGPSSSSDFSAKVTTKMKTTITKDNLDAGTTPSSSSRAWVKKVGCAKDDAGHIIGNALGGVGSYTENNIFPQNPSVNRGAFRVFEKQIRDMLMAKDPRKVCDKFEITVDLSYSSSSSNKYPARPEKVDYVAKCVDGTNDVVLNPSAFSNPLPSGC